MKKILIILGIILLLLGVTWGISVLLIPSEVGERLASEKDIPYPVVIAHRGASGVAPESTEVAYELARDMGADYLEADLQRTEDGEIIAFHDDTPARTTNVEEIFPGREEDYIETFTYEELQKLDAGSWFNEQYPEKAREEFEGLQVLRLEELIEIVEEGENNPGLYLETKSAPRHPGIEEDIIEILENEGWLPEPPDLDSPEPDLLEKIGAPSVDLASGPARLIFQSFYQESIEELEDLLVEIKPQIPRVLLISPDKFSEYGWDNLLEFAESHGHGIGPNGFLVWPWYLRDARKQNLMVHPYVINQTWQMRLMELYETDGIFTDFPHLALEVYGKSDSIDVDQLWE